MEMRAALLAMAQAGRDRRDFGEADLQFHIAVASGNPLFRSSASVIETALRALLVITTSLDERTMSQTVVQHVVIADAIVAGDGASTADAMFVVVNEGANRMIGSLG